MDIPEISVLITTYNVAGYIARTVESVLAQTGVSFEVVIVDDGSSDGTWEIVCALDDPRITAIQMEQNAGPSGARNRAIDTARGEWLAILDGDDVFLPGRLERMRNLAATAAADIVVDNQLVMREADGGQSPMFEASALAAEGVLSVASFIRHNVDFSCGHGYGYFKPLLRAAFLREHGLRYRETIRIGEDYVFLLEALANGGVCVIDPVPGYGYTVRTGSISYRLKERDVASIQTEDVRFFAVYQVSDEALAAQRIRARNLIETFAFVQMVAAVKARRPVAFLKAFYSCPRALRQWKKPIMKRLLRRKA